MTENRMPIEGVSAWNVMRCSSLEGFRTALGIDPNTNGVCSLETIATAMLLLPPGVLSHRNPKDVDAVFESLVRLGAIPESATASQAELDAAMDDSIPTDAHLPSHLRKQAD